MNVTFPAWVSVILVVLAAVLAYLQTQTGVHFDAVAALIVGVAQVAIATLLGFQRPVTATVRRMRGLPPRG